MLNVQKLQNCVFLPSVCFDSKVCTQAVFIDNFLIACVWPYIKYHNSSNIAYTEYTILYKLHYTLCSHCIVNVSIL